MTLPRLTHAVLAVAAILPCMALLVGMACLVVHGVVALMDGASRGLAGTRAVLDPTCPVWTTMGIVVPIGTALGAWLARSSPASCTTPSLMRCLDACASVPTGLLGGAVGTLASLSGVSTDATVAALAVVALPALALRVARAVQSIPRDLEETALALGASQSQRFVHVALAHSWKPVMASIFRVVARVMGESVAVMVATLAASGNATVAHALLMARVGAASTVLTVLTVAATLVAWRLEERLEP